ncbi:hypothetical protein ES708_08547 [subsurface metagenome]
MGLKDPVGERLSVWGNEGTIIGVVKDFNFHRLIRAIDPLILFIVPDYFQEVVLRVSPLGLKKNLGEITKIWEKFYPGEPFEYRFLDDEFDQMYRSEQQMGTLFNYFVILAILISCLGLFGLASFMAEQRTKEIGIRKAHGSSVFNIFLLMNTSFVRWVLLANLIAWPVAGYAMHKWLRNYAYQTNLSWWIFSLPAQFPF